jgi:hypothetical protein
MRCLLSIFVMCFTILYVGACLLLTTGQIEMSVLCSFSCDFSVGGEGFLWVRCFMFCLGMTRLHCCSVFVFVYGISL